MYSFHATFLPVGIAVTANYIMVHDPLLGIISELTHFPRKFVFSLWHTWP